MRVDFSRILECINPVYHPYFNDYRRIQIYKGGAGAGKSRGIAQRQIYRTVVNKNHNGVCIRNNNTNNHKSTFPELIEAIMGFGILDLFKINEADGKESITCLLNGNKIIFRGLDDVEKIKSITIPGGGISWIWVEEASEIAEKSFNQLLLRIRGISLTPKIIILSFNPINSDHWIKSRFFDRRIRPEDGYICESTYLDNKYLTAADRASIEAFKDIDWYYYQVYALNQWGSINTSRVFQNIEVHDFDIPEWQMTNIRQGLDFGWSHAQAFIRGGFVDKELYIFNEVWAKETINRDFITMIKNTGFPPELIITADSADPGAIKEVNEAGLNCIGAIKGPGSVLRGINFLRRIPRIHIHQTNCPNTERSFNRFKFRETKDGKIHEAQYVEIDDDPIAAARYAFQEFHVSGIDDKPVNYFAKGS